MIYTKKEIYNVLWHIFILYFSIAAFTEQLSGSHANEIKHDHSHVVIVVLDPRYDLSYKALHIYRRGIALRTIYNWSSSS